MTIRAIARKCVLDILGLFAKPAPGVHILNGHVINRNHITDADCNKFRKLLTALSANAKFVNFEAATQMIKQGKIPNEPIIAFSFDDGFTDDYLAIAPVLEEFGVNAAFFINPNFASGNEEYTTNFTENIVLTPGKNPMNWNQIKELHSRGHIIGAHTMDHYMINSDNRKELEYQIVECKKVIEDKLGATCDYFAFPYGRLEHANQMAIDIACETYPYVYSQSDYKHYFSFGGKVINRRHFEPFWPTNHVNYFLSCRKG